MAHRSTERAARLTGAQIDALLELPETELRDALQRLQAETQREANRRRDWRDTQEALRQAYRAQDALEAAIAARHYTPIEQALAEAMPATQQSRRAAVQGDNGSEA
jgi:DNA-binding GntR family transcriptional regulator